jgi:Fe-S cluster assembly protein SufB
MKSISKNGGKSVYRGLVEVGPGAEDAAVSVKCDALLLDEFSISDTIPVMKINNASATIAHEASAGKINAEDLFYLRSRGLKEAEAAAMVVNGFIEPITKELPLEYSVEMNRMVELEMENSVG